MNLRLDIDNLGSVGLISDIPGFAIKNLPAFTNGRNFQIQEEAIASLPGFVQEFLPLFTPYFMIGAYEKNAINYFLMYAGNNKIGLYDGQLQYDVTPMGILPSVNWAADIINSNIVITNGINKPYYWDSNLTPLVEHSTFNADSCRNIRSYKGYLFAFDISDGGVRFPFRLKWSQEAVTGVPLSWDETDPATGAGMIDFGDNGTVLLDGKVLRDTFFLYGEKQTYKMRYVGGIRIFEDSIAFRNQGILARNCVVEFQNEHVVVIDGDIVRHDGQNVTSIINGRNRRNMFSNISTDYYQNTFVVRDDANQEIWFCYPEQGYQYPNVALIWNYITDKWTKTELPYQATFIVSAVKNDGNPLLWQDANFLWQDANILWGQRLFNPTNNVLFTSFNNGDPATDVVTNGNFVADTDWTKGTGWTISGGHAICSGAQAGDTSLSQTLTLEEDVTYSVHIVTSNISAGEVRVNVDGNEVIGPQDFNGSFDGRFTASGVSELLEIIGDANFTGHINSVSTRKIKVAKMNQGISFFGNEREAYIERIGFYIPDEDGRINPRMIKTLLNLYPQMLGDATVFMVGAQMVPDGPITWLPEMTFTPGTDHKIDCRISGRLFCLRIKNEATWRISGLSFEYVESGET